MKMTKKAAEEITGGLSSTSKMPCNSYGLPTYCCKIGSILRKIDGTICSTCYASKGLYTQYAYCVVPAQEKRLASIKHPLWVPAMVKLISSGNPEKLFRWHDSGDLQDMEHLGKIVEIANLMPDYRFWLPTREVELIAHWLRQNGTFPKNLIVRISAAKIGAPAPTVLTGYGSTVHKGHDAPAGSVACGAYTRGGRCGDCRLCWSAPAISYPWH